MQNAECRVKDKKTACGIPHSKISNPGFQISNLKSNLRLVAALPPMRRPAPIPTSFGRAGWGSGTNAQVIMQNKNGHPRGPESQPLNPDLFILHSAFCILTSDF
jgi:hypothetical protein